MKQKTYLSAFHLLLIASVAGFLLFAQLDRYPLVTWDESRQAVNAVEMLDHRNPLVTTFEGETDLWNTKPSLLVATQALSFKIFGINELALRIPTAFAGLLLCLFIYWFFVKQYQSKSGGWVAVLTLLTMEGFNGYHCTRTGDFDSFLCLFTTFYLVSFYLFLQNLNRRYLLGFFAGVVLAVLSKGVAGLMFLPAVFLYTLFSRKLIAIIRLPVFWLMFFLSTLFILSYYLYRDFHTPGYLAAIYENELWGRFGEVKEGHRGSNWMYVLGLINTRAFPWVLLLPVGLAVWYIKFRHLKQITSGINYFLLMLLFWLLIISVSQTKLEWYDAPMIPLIAIAFSLTWVNIFKELYKTPLGLRGNFVKSLLMWLCIAGFALTVIQRGRYLIFKPLPTCIHCIESNHFGALLNNGLKQGRNFDGYSWTTSFTYKNHNALNFFYVEKLKREYNQTLHRKSPSEWQSGDKILLLQPHLLDSLPPTLRIKNQTEKFTIIEIEIE